MKYILLDKGYNEWLAIPIKYAPLLQNVLVLKKEKYDSEVYLDITPKELPLQMVDEEKIQVFGIFGNAKIPTSHEDDDIPF